MIVLKHEYACSPELLWHIITDIDCLEKVMAGLIKFYGLPKGQIFEGQKITVDVSLFGFMPRQEYIMYVKTCDPEQRVVESHEVGAGVKYWRHTMQIIPTDSGATLIDTLDIDAGLATPVFNTWARFMYRARHKPRLKLIAQLPASSPS